MKALCIPGKGVLSMIDIPDAVPGPEDVLLKPLFVGFCGSDLNTFRGGNAMAKENVIPGHEIGAEIVSVGSAVPPVFKPGMTVTVNPYTSCGVCPSCRNSRPNACADNETLGVQRDGAMRDYIAVPWQKIIPAEGLGPMECALVEPMSVGFHAVSRAGVTDSDTVMVIGCGMVGLGAVVRASLRGACVIAADIDDGKLSLAREMGASFALNTMSPSFHEELSALTGGDGPSVVIEAVGSPVTYRMAVDEVSFTGRVICIGYSKSEVSFQTGLFVKKELDIRGSRNALPSDFEAVIRYMKRGVCPVDRLVSAVVKPSGARAALERWSADPGKVFRILVDFR